MPNFLDTIFSGIKTGIQNAGNFVSGAINTIKEDINPTVVQPISKPKIISDNGTTKLINESATLPPVKSSAVAPIIPTYANPADQNISTAPKISQGSLVNSTQYLTATGKVSNNPPPLNMQEVANNKILANPFSDILATGKLFAADAWQNIQNLSQALKNVTPTPQESQGYTDEEGNTHFTGTPKSAAQQFADTFDLGLSAANFVLTPISFAVKIAQHNPVLAPPTNILVNGLNSLANGGNGFKGTNATVKDVFGALPDFSNKDNLMTSVQNITSFAVQSFVIGKLIGELHQGNVPTDVTVGKFATEANEKLQAQALDTINQFVGEDNKINVNSTPEEIQDAFHEAAHITHPDKAMTYPDTANENNFKAINAAYQFLNNPEGTTTLPTTQNNQAPQTSSEGNGLSQEQIKHVINDTAGYQGGTLGIEKDNPELAAKIRAIQLPDTVSGFGELQNIIQNNLTPEEYQQALPDINRAFNTDKMTEVYVKNAKKAPTNEKNPIIPPGKLSPDAMYQQADQLSTKLLQDLQGREFTSRQYIQQRLASSDLNLKQVEKNIVEQVLQNYPSDKIPVKEFTQKVKDELLPLKRNSTDSTDEESLVSQYENISLPEPERGNIDNYSENVYQSPIQTSAGDVHFSGALDDKSPQGYFGHTRVEDMTGGKIRRVIEVQSDLYQKGRLDKDFSRSIGNNDQKSVEFWQKELKDNPNDQEAKDQLKFSLEAKKLRQYNDPTAHFRMVREEVKQAAIDGKTKLQFPTGETAMKIEGLGETRHWTSVENFTRFMATGNNTYLRDLSPEKLTIGKEIIQAGEGTADHWIITKVLDDGKFEAVPKERLDQFLKDKGFNIENQNLNGQDRVSYARQHTPRVFDDKETFDISGKIDTNNPIYKFYEKELAKYLKSKYGATTVTDKNGVTWNQIDVKPEMAKQPVEAFSPRNTGKDITISQATKQLYKLFNPQEVKFLTQDGLIKMPGGGLAFGKSARGLIELVANDGTVKDQTLYHEAFHQYTQQFLSSGERFDIQREGIEMAKKEGLPVKTLDQAEEYLADKFAEYVKDKSTFTGKIRQFFENLLNTIKKLMGKGQKVLDIFNDILSKKRPEDLLSREGDNKFQQLTPYEEDQYRREVEKEMETAKEFSTKANKDLSKDILAAGGLKIDPNNPGEYQDIPLHLLSKNGLSADAMLQTLNQGGKYSFGSPYDVLEAAKKVQGAITNVKPKIVGVQAKMNELNNGYPTNDKQELNLIGESKIEKEADPKLVAEPKPVRAKVTETDQNYGLSYAYNIDKPGAGKVFDINALSDEAKSDFQKWVNAKRTIPTMGYAAAKPFKIFDKEGVDGFLRFNAGFKEGMKPVEEYFDKRYKDASKLGIDMGFKYNYLPQLWNNSAAEILKAYQNFKGTALGLRPAFSLEAVFKDYAEGMKAGLTPKFKNISQLINWYEQRFQKAKADIEYYNKLAEKGAVQPSNSVEENPGWKMVDPERWPQKQIYYTGSDGIDRLYQGTMSTPTPLANLINNNLRPGSALLRVPATVMSKLKNVVMSVGVPGTGINPHGVNMLGRAFLLSANHPSIGVTALKYVVYPNSAKSYLDANMDQLIQASKLGLTISNEDHEFNAIGKKVLEPPKLIGGKALKLATEGVKKINDTLYGLFGKNTFEKMIPALKIRTWMFEKADLMKKGMDETAAGKQAALTTNEFLSGKNIEQIGRSKDFQNLLRTIVFAPDFAETGFGMGANMGKSGFNWKNPKYNIYRLAAITLIGSYIAMNLWNKKTSGKYMFENASGHQFDVFVGTDTNGKDVWFRPFGSSVDFARLPLDVIAGIKAGDLTPIQSIFMNRVSVGTQLIMRPLFNVDAFGNPIFGRTKYGQKMSVGQQLGNLIGTEANTLLPGSIDAIIKKNAGLSNAQVGSEALGLPFRFNASGVSSQQIQDLRDQATAEIKTGNYKTFNQLVKEGVILPKDRTQFIRNALKPQALKDIIKQRAALKLKNEKASINAQNGRPASNVLDSFLNLIK